MINNFKERNPYQDDSSSGSLSKAPEIVDSIKKNPELATAEIEKKELVVKPGLMGLYKAQGKTHANGGIKTYLEPDSFVFSNDGRLAFNEEDHSIMELKKGSKWNSKNNTPAEVLKRNIDVKHYNTLLNNLKDPKTNDITKKSSVLMLKKYQETLGKIAFLQEEKKNFEEPIPDWAQNSAPVYDGQLKTNIKEQLQYMKYGGVILPKMVDGGFADDVNDDKECLCGRNTDGSCKPCTDAEVDNYIKKAKVGTLNDVNGMKVVRRNANGALYHSGTDGKTRKKYNGPLMSNDKWTAWLKTPKGIAYTNSLDSDNLVYVPTTPGFNRMRGSTIKPGGVTEIVSDAVANPTPEMDLKNTLPYNPYVGLSREQVGNLGYLGLQAASVKRYDPYRQQIKSPLIEQEYYNVQPALNQIDNSTYQAMNASRTLNPYLSNSANMEILGKGIDSKGQANSQYAERNVGVGNLQNQTNNQIMRGDLAANLGFDKKYYDETVTARQNFDNLKQVANNKVFDTTNEFLSDNRQLQEFLAQQPIAGNVAIKDKKGRIIGYRAQPLYDYNSWTGRVVNTGAGNIMNAKKLAKTERYDETLNALLEKALDGSLTKSQGAALNALLSLSKTKKMGGTINPYN